MVHTLKMDLFLPPLIAPQFAQNIALIILGFFQPRICHFQRLITMSRIHPVGNPEVQTIVICFHPIITAENLLLSYYYTNLFFIVGLKRHKSETNSCRRQIKGLLTGLVPGNNPLVTADKGCKTTQG